MAMQISNSMSTSAVSWVSARSPEQQAFKDLRIAMRGGDIDAAKQAFGAIVRNAPEGAKWNPESSFAQIGRALVAGDMDAAKSAYASMVKNHLPRNDVSPPVTQPIEPPNFTPGQVSLTA
jgi:hypothetical protein